MNLLNQPLSWDPDLYGWNPNQNTDGMRSSQAFGSAEAFGSPLHEPARPLNGKSFENGVGTKGTD
ncbi:hypothetical protein Hanom_Chr00s057741g01783661 [Helianthus anomalus]